MSRDVDVRIYGKYEGNRKKEEKHKKEKNGKEKIYRKSARGIRSAVLQEEVISYRKYRRIRLSGQNVDLLSVCEKSALE